MPHLWVRDLRAGTHDVEILQGVNLALHQAEIHALMGPNGSGKSTLAKVLMGHPGYRILAGEIRLFGEDIRTLPVHERAKRGLFLAFQYPVEVPGVSVANFLRSAVNAVREEPLRPLDFYRLLHDQLEYLEMDPDVAERYLNEGFSGGEKKRSEILQMALLRPRIALLDEIDSGLDVDALRVVAKAIRQAAEAGAGILIITHYHRILEHLQPDFVHIMAAGRIIQSGGPELAVEVERSGYEPFLASYESVEV
ncbi:MAG: Fe-S cluster assembly ATPase SufC [candidate division KSB1 bacterium]|nr:Fe-S cluster assembly ATPase SufC [candidate division KSB1 bacterium]